MTEESLAAAAGHDLVVIALPGVQRFISESQSTADVRAASEIIARLASRAAEACESAGGVLVFPSSSGDQARATGEAGGAADGALDGMPNRVVALAGARSGSQMAECAVAAVNDAWMGWVRQALKLPEGGRTPGTPGFPVAQWACVPAGPDGYVGQWERAQGLLDARRRVRDFPLAGWMGSELCALSPRWPAESSPAGLKPHEKATLSAANWVKRRWRQIQHLDGFASTSSIASAGYRRDVLGHLDDPEVRAAVDSLMDAASQILESRETRVAGLAAPRDQPGRWLAQSGGPWVYPEQWQTQSLARESGKDLDAIRDAVAAGAAASAQLRAITADRYGTPPAATYLAVIVQDLDGMGRFLSGRDASAAGERIGVAAAEHRRISAALRELAGKQRSALESAGLLGVAVYAGGDDLLAFTPAVTALEAAQACHDLIPASLPTASTAVLLFHYQAGLQSAMTRAHDLLDQAKEAVPGKHALAVGYLRRSGVADFSIQPWPGPLGGSSTGLLRLFAADTAYPLSPRLVADLERDGEELGRLQERDAGLYRAELGRLVRRHIGGDTAGTSAAARRATSALAWLAEHEYSPGAASSSGPRPERAARVGVFLRQEAR